MGRGANVLRRAAGALSSPHGLVAPAAAAAGLTKSRGLFNLFTSPNPTGPPMTEPLTGISASSPAPTETSPPSTQVTTLSNGVKVATENTYGPTTTLGVYVDAGSVYETPANSGVSHMLEQMAFKGTANRTFFRVVREIEAMGGNVVASSSREQMGYNVDCLRTFTPESLELLLDAVINPKFTAWDMKAQVKVIKADLLAFAENPASMLNEAMHYTAYQGGLGKPLILTPEALGRLTPSDLEEFVAEHYTGNRMVLSASGVEHSELLGLAQDLLGDIPAGSPAPKVPSAYLGGDFRQNAPSSPLTTVMLGFEFAGGWKDVKGSVVVTVMQYLLGGGSSFSAGGPGKGMHSRLYTRVLNRNLWVSNCQAVSSLYNDTGLVGITVTGDSTKAESLIGIAATELQSLTASVPAEELERAKRAAVSSVLMNLESKAIVCEDIGRQVLTYGHRKEVSEFVAAIEAVTAADVAAVASKMLKTPPTVASHGATGAIPRYDAICKMF